MDVLLIVYDNESAINHFPQGIAYIASSLIRYGHTVKIYSQDIYHYDEQHLTDYLNYNHFDIVGVGVIGGYYQYKKLLALSEAINSSTNRKDFKYILGGHGPSPEPRFFLEKTRADFVVIGEGEHTTVDLLDNLDKPDTVDGIAFIKDGQFIKTKERKQIKNIDSIPTPAYDLFDINHYALLKPAGFSNTDRCMSVLSGRGCPYKCNFCYRMDKGFRPRSNDSIIGEIATLKRKYNITGIEFSDELLMSSEKRVISLCEDFIRFNLNIKWACNGRLNFASLEVLNIMKKAGCTFINYGIECLDDEILKIMNKHLTVNMIIKGVENTKTVGIHAGLNFIFGNIGEDKKHMNRALYFLQKYGDGSQLRTIRPVTPYPGSPLYYYAIGKGLLKGPADFYENKHTNSDLITVNFSKLTDEEVYKHLNWVNKKLIVDYYSKNEKNITKQCDDLYKKQNSSFRGFRNT